MDFKVSNKTLKIIGGICTGVGLLANLVSSVVSSETQKHEIMEAAKEAVKKELQS